MAWIRVNVIAICSSGGLLEWDMGLGSIEIGSLGPLKTLPLDHTSGSPESLLGLLPYINKLPLELRQGEVVRSIHRPLAWEM